jgi:hypothetical protein
MTDDVRARLEESPSESVLREHCFVSGFWSSDEVNPLLNYFTDEIGLYF